MFCVVEKRVDASGPLSVYATKPAPSLVLLPMTRGCDFVSKYYNKSNERMRIQSLQPDLGLLCL